MGRGLVGEELAAGEAVLAEEEAVVGGEDDVGVAQLVHGAERGDDLLDAVVDRAQRLQHLLVVDAVRVPFARREVRGFTDEAGLVVDVALVEAFRRPVREGGAAEGVIVAGRRLRPGRAAEVAVRGGVVELQIEGRPHRRSQHLFVGNAGEDVGLIQAGFAVERREGAAEVVAFAVFAGVPAAGVAERPFQDAVVVQRVAVVVVVGVGLDDRVPGAPARWHGPAVVEWFVAIAVEELADVDRAVAGALQPGGDVVGVGLAVAEAGVAAVGRDVAADVVVVGVAAGHQAHPRGAAEGIGDVVAVEGHPFCGDQVQRVRHRRDRRAAGRRVAGVELVQRLVVGLDHDEVRLLPLWRQRDPLPLRGAGDRGRGTGALLAGGEDERRQQRQHARREHQPGAQQGTLRGSWLLVPIHGEHLGSKPAPIAGVAAER